jgi:hypothetical protein
MAKENEPILMTIGDKAITKSEFEYIWKKNNTNYHLRISSRLTNTWIFLSISSSR